METSLITDDVKLGLLIIASFYRGDHRILASHDRVHMGDRNCSCTFTHP